MPSGTDMTEPEKELFGPSFNVGEGGWLHDALIAFKAAGAEPPKEALLACGHACLEKGSIEDALIAFKAAGTVPPKSRLLESGNACLEQGSLYEALLAFTATQDKEGLLACADAFLQKGLIVTALDVFRAAKVDPPQDKLVRYAESGRLQGQANQALTTFLAAADKETLLTCGNRWLETGWVHGAVAAFEAAGDAPPKDKVLSCGQAVFEKGHIHEALLAFRLVAHCLLLNKSSLSERTVQKRHTHEALAAYQAAGVQARNELIGFAESCLKNGQVNKHLKRTRSSALPLRKTACLLAVMLFGWRLDP